MTNPHQTPARQPARPGIEEFDAHDGLMPASLRSVFVPEGDARDARPDRREPPAALQALAVLALLSLPFWVGVAGVPA